MKYIELYESFESDKQPKFKVGDIVYCIIPSDELVEHQKYKVLNVFDNYGLYTINVTGMTNKNKFSETRKWGEGRFISELEYMSKKYNIL